MKQDVSNSELIILLLIYPLSFLYISYCFEYGAMNRILFSVFTLAFVAFGEFLFKDVKRSLESSLFLAMVVIGMISVLFDLGQVCDTDFSQVLLHLFAVYWLLCRSGKLYKGRTSNLFLLDGFNGFVLTPFGNYFLFFKNAVAGLRKRRGDNKLSWNQVLVVLVAGLAGILLLMWALKLLSHADGNFESLIRMPELEWTQWSVDLALKLVLSIFVTLYLYGLFAGSYRRSSESLTEKAAGMDRMVSELAIVPEWLWFAFIGLFSLIYLAFFILQGSYMFNAFQMVLPENYTFSDYARRGFADMIGVAGINFLLLWLTQRTSRKPEVMKKGGILLTAETLIFTLIASLKIFMYIQAYGFTPLRVQSIWLCGVLLFTCGCVLWRLVTGRNVVRVWFNASACSLALLMIL